MSRFTLILAAFLALVPILGLQAAAEDYKAKVMAFLMSDAGDTKPKITLNLVDLNGDGVPEALATVTSPVDCGSHGCTAYVLDLTGPKARSIGDFIAFDLKALPTKTNGWRDISLNGIKQVYRAGKYVSARTVDTPPGEASSTSALASPSAYADQDYCGRLSSDPTAFVLHERGKPDIDISSDNPDLQDPKGIYDYLNTHHPDSDKSCYCVTGVVVVQKHGDVLLRDFVRVEGLKRCGGAVLR